MYIYMFKKYYWALFHVSASPVISTLYIIIGVIVGIVILVVLALIAAVIIVIVWLVRKHGQDMHKEKR